MTLPRLHVVTDDDVLAGPGFRERAAALLGAYGPGLALHVRSPAGDVRRQLACARALVPAAADAGGLVVVNDRPDVALATDAAGVQLGRRSVPVQAVRSMLNDAVVVGYSAHGAAEAASAVANGADFVLIGAIWDTPSHPGREGAGLALVRATVAAARAPVIAIGGVTPERARRARDDGAWGVAAIRGIWYASDPVAAAGRYLEAMEVEQP